MDKQSTALKQPKKENKNKGMTLAMAPEGKKLYDKLVLNDVKQQQVRLENKITGAEKQNPNYSNTKEDCCKRNP